ncbi:MAG TPA: flagellar motor switch protein FliG [Microthrixaceae bacterium]|nr:flagellar motor switch protein FliG [Microthrixaceae bacterium]
MTMATAGARRAALTVDNLNGLQKAAILLMAVGKERAAKVLGELSEAEITEIMGEVALLPSVSAEVVESVLEEFDMSAKARSQIATGGMDVAKDILEATVGTAKMNEIFERLSINFISAPFEFVRRVEPRMVLSYIRGEHPQTIALVLAHMLPESAATVLSGLPEDLQRDVAVRVATMDRTSPEIIEVVEASLEKRLSTYAQQSELSQAGGVQSLVALLNRSDRSTERLIFEGLDVHDSSLAAEVRSRMFVFEDVLTLDDLAVQQILRRVDTKDLAMALKGVRDEVRDKVLSNLSTRAAESLVDDIEILGAVRLTAVESAQGEVVATIREMEDAGEIILVRMHEEFVE